MNRGGSQLEVQGLTKRFGGLVALEDVGFCAHSGEILGILGPNGAGKTTLFNLLSGFLAAERGSARLDGQEVLGKSPRHMVALGLARTFQLCRPFADLSVEENVLVACHGPRARSSGERPQQRARRMLRDVGLEARAQHPAGQLSYGDQRRLEVARALATGPRWLLLDEPFAGLGSSEIAPLSALIQRLHAGGLGIIIIEHKLREFMQLAQSVVALDFGRVVTCGTPEEIVRHPKVVEAYIGKEAPDAAAPA